MAHGREHWKEGSLACLENGKACSSLSILTQITAIRVEKIIIILGFKKRPFLRRKWARVVITTLTLEDGYSLQLSSSDPSVQSFLWLHFWYSGTHCSPLAQANSWKKNKISVQSRVARFFLLQLTKTGKIHIPKSR
jgi:hypothetical protein